MGNATRVLVTGAGGFIGSHLVERLVAEGYAVRAFLRYTSQRSWGNLQEAGPEVLSAVEPYYADIRDGDAVRRALDGVSILFHLAALMGIPYSYLHPREVVDVNVMGTLNVLQAAREAGVQRLIVTSTSEVYGTAQQVPIPETHPLHPQSPYAASKVAADALAVSFHHAYGLPVVVVRPFNAFGPRQSTRAVIPTVISQALAGETVAVGATTPRRDFTYVTDTVGAFVRAAAAPEAVGKVFNVGRGSEISVGELIALVGDCVGKPLRVTTEARRLRPEASEVQRLCADARQAETVLGWRPSVSLAEGIRRTVDWWKRRAVERVGARPGERAGEYAV
ncbi:MAG: SDR family NAD(P)-dependent oxidoreductase [Candidatus Omnitrophica bacterium]|nr:SDR family NAD(P)-dependent oxidoreductase [Candidatus Omnitrophota bacterium]